MSLGRVGAALACLMVLGYITAAFGLAWWLGHSNPHNRIGATDLALPWRWSSLRGLRGEGFIEQGREEMAAGNEAQGIFWLRRGLQNRPNHAEARLTLARYYAKYRYYSGIRQVAEPQLKFGFSRELVGVWFDNAVEADDTETVLETATALLERPDLEWSDRLWLLRWRLAQLQRADRPAEVLAALAGAGLADESEYVGYAVDALLAQGRTEEALAVVRELPLQRPPEYPRTQVNRIRVWAANGPVDELQREADQLLRDYEFAPEFTALAAVQLSKAGRPDLAAERLDAFFLRKASNRGLVENLISQLASKNQVELAQAALAQAVEWGHAPFAARVAVAMAEVNAARWRDLAESRRRMFSFGEELPPQALLLRDLLDGILESANDPAETTKLVAAINRAPFVLSVYLQAINGFAQSESWSVVQVLADAAGRIYPHSVQLADWSARTEKHLATLDGESVDQRAEQVRATAGAGFEATSANQLRTGLEDLLQQSRWTEVGSQVRQARRARPDWLPAMEAELSRFEARAALGTRDWLRLQQLLPGLLRQGSTSVDWVLDATAGLAEAGNVETARRLLSIVRREQPDDERVEALWRQIAPQEISDNLEQIAPVDPAALDPERP